MSIQTEINRINTEVSDQSTLLDQAIAALAGKAAGSGSGGTVETCTVTVTEDIGSWDQFTYTALVNGIITPIYNSDFMASSPIVLENVVCGTAITFMNSHEEPITYGEFEVSGGVTIIAQHYDDMASVGVLLCRAPTVANAEGTILVA